MNSTAELKRIKLADIVPSATNPRKNFKTPDWPDFVESIRTHGVIQPGVCRPGTGSLNGKFDGPLKGKYELVAGERRYRASLEAKLADMPLVVRELTDAQVVEIQQIENLQREDLSALEEAQGYAAWRDSLMMKGGQSKTVEEAVAHICSKINRKRSAVFQRLALLKATLVVKKALQDGKLDATKAQLISQIPDPKDQAECLEEAIGSYHEMSYRELKEHIEEQYRMKLKEATFDQTKVFNGLQGLPDKMRSAPACTTCPFNTANMGDKFPDAAKTPNVCTNPVCFKAKTQAHTDAVLSKAKSEGKPVISAEAYKKQRYSFTEAKDTCYSNGSNGKSYATLAKVAGIQPKIAVNDEGQIQEVFTREDIGEIKKANKIKEMSYDNGVDRKAQAARQKKQKAYRVVAGAATAKILEKLVTKTAAGDIQFNKQLWPAIAQAAYDGTDIEKHDFTAKRRKLSESMNDSRTALTKFLKQTTDPLELARFALELLICSNWEGGGWHKVEWSTKFLAVAKLAGVDVKKLEKEEPKKAALTKTLKARAKKGKAK